MVRMKQLFMEWRVSNSRCYISRILCGLLISFELEMLGMK